jgi:demethylmenaquinone methyltransferase/2-methoxy-6-polyprenyl-1,4-benzoquinol methylase
LKLLLVFSGIRQGVHPNRFKNSVPLFTFDPPLQMSSTDEKLIPHPPLKNFYEDEAQRNEFVNRIFNDTAKKYDPVNNILSLGSGNWYRKKALLRSGLAPEMDVLDVATGTGLVAKSESAIVGPNGSVIGLDRSYNMLTEVGKKLNIPLVLGDANGLPFADNSFHFLTMGYALRHVDDLKTTFSEYFRVLKPGGTLLILELMKPTNKMIYKMIQFYFRLMVAVISLSAIGGKNEGKLIKYYWETIDQFVGSGTIKKTLSEAGFEKVNSHQLFNFFTEFTAVKP